MFLLSLSEILGSMSNHFKEKANKIKLGGHNE